MISCSFFLSLHRRVCRLHAVTRYNTKKQIRLWDNTVGCCYCALIYSRLFVCHTRFEYGRHIKSKPLLLFLLFYPGKKRQFLVLANRKWKCEKHFLWVKPPKQEKKNQSIRTIWCLLLNWLTFLLANTQPISDGYQFFIFIYFYLLLLIYTIFFLHFYLCFLHFFSSFRFHKRARTHTFCTYDNY